MSKRILIVDDEAGFSRLLKLNLEQQAGFEVSVHNNGMWAVEAARRFKPDVILLDIVMPDASGREIAEQLAADSLLRKVPIIFITATVSRDDIVAVGGELNGWHTLAKPVTVQQVIDAVREALAATPAG